jgi:hypothetical protein
MPSIAEQLFRSTDKHGNYNPPILAVANFLLAGFRNGTGQF